MLDLHFSLSMPILFRCFSILLRVRLSRKLSYECIGRQSDQQNLLEMQLRVLNLREQYNYLSELQPERGFLICGFYLQLC